MLFLLSRFFIKKITVLSQAIISSYSPVFHSKMHAIANLVHPAKTLADPVGAKATKVILNVGRLNVQKDQKTLVKAFARLADDFPDWNLRIVGEGELRQDLEALVADLGLGTRISLPGVTTEIDKEYLAAQIFALPSTYESFGLATAEAMAHGLPTLGFASCPGTNELIIHNQNGLLVEEQEDRVGAFADGLKSLVNDQELRVKLGAQGIQSIQQFDPDVIIQKWEDLIKNVSGTI